MNKSAKTILIIGNIASGKSTTATIIAQTLNSAVLVPEPVDENPFLPLYAVDQKRWAFTCQTFYFQSYIETYQKILTKHPEAQYFIIDAGAQSNLYVYGKYMKEQEVVTKDEGRYFDTLTTLISSYYHYPTPDICIYADAPVELCFERLHARGRAYEVIGHTKEYLETIGSYIKTMTQMFETQGIPVIHYDTQRYREDSVEGNAFLVKTLTDQLSKLPPKP